MRCISCDKNLNDFEATRKYANTLTYVDMCQRCFKSSDTEGILVLERTDLKPNEFIEEDHEDGCTECG